ncbi:hypothetical protein [Pontibacter sp. G13]|uniref:hypothetical protein n=1 Tax=Pontibacter sp. G13 TaxID=3074898 RepID=UPI00288BD114|nr:hypothetical protein [Pontibacter sp. G13]WNJ17796.1 hypothetical protein RJD25_23335 [Pontibacter sp. G13]
MNRLICLIWLLLVVLSPTAQAQIHLNPGVDTTEYRMAEVYHFLEQYYQDFRADGQVDYAAYFSPEAVARYVHPDKVAFSIFGRTPAYLVGSPNIISLQKREDRYHVQVAFQHVQESGATDILFICEHLVACTPNGPQFLVNLDHHTADWSRRTIRNITFVWPGDTPFDSLGAAALIHDVEQLEQDWALEPIDITYYYTARNEEIQRIRGFLFNFNMSRTEYPSGLSDIPDHVTFSSGWGARYFHEVVHIYLNPIHPKFPLNEGLTVWYGGSMGHHLDWHIRRLSTYLEEHPDLDLNDRQSFYYMDSQTNPQSTIDGFLCQWVYEHAGLDGLKRLCTFEQRDQIYKEMLGIDPSEFNAWLRAQIAVYGPAHPIQDF